MRRLSVPLVVIAPMLVSCTGAGPEAVLTVAATPEPPASTMPVPAFVAPEYSGPRLPGRWGVYVDAANAPTSFPTNGGAGSGARAGGVDCVGMTYDVPAGSIIRDTMIETSNNAFDTARALSSPPRNGNIGGLTWALSIRVTRTEGSFVRDETTAGPVARADLNAEITVLDKRGEVVRTMTESAAAMSDAGSGGCNAGAALLTLAYQRASLALMNEVIPELGTN